MRSSCETLATKSCRMRFTASLSVRSCSTSSTLRAAGSQRRDVGAHEPRPRRPQPQVARHRAALGARAPQQLVSSGARTNSASGVPGARRARRAEDLREAVVAVHDPVGAVDQRHAVAHVREDVLALVALALERREPRAQLAAMRLSAAPSRPELVVGPLRARARAGSPAPMRARHALQRAHARRVPVAQPEEQRERREQRDARGEQRAARSSERAQVAHDRERLGHAHDREPRRRAAGTATYEQVRAERAAVAHGGARRGPASAARTSGRSAWFSSVRGVGARVGAPRAPSRATSVTRQAERARRPRARRSRASRRARARTRGAARARPARRRARAPGALRSQQPAPLLARRHQAVTAASASSTTRP